MVSMRVSHTPTHFSLTSIAETGVEIVDFAPYVPAVDDAGVVTFHAARADGGSCVLAGSGGALRVVAESPTGARFISHPDTNCEGALVVYASHGPNVALRRIEGATATTLAGTSGAFSGIGPLGPTMSRAGDVAFRADTLEGGAGVFLWRAGRAISLADSSRFATFYGLPVAYADGAVAFRADTPDGRQGIYVAREGTLEAVVETGARFQKLGFFPCASDAGQVVFAATDQDGAQGIFCAAGGEARVVVDATTHGFESVRGALVDDEGAIVFFATPRGGALGVYAAGASADTPPVIAVGDARFGAPVTELALNPVSIAPGPRIAIRLRLGDGRQLVVRADPA